MLKETKKYYLIRKENLYTINNQDHLIELEKSYEDLDFCLNDIKKALYKFYFEDEDPKENKSRKEKLIKNIINNLENEYILIERTIKTNKKNLQYITNKIVELKFIKWWE